MLEQKEFLELYAKLLEKASVDQQFRVELKADPRKAISSVFGEPIPESFTIKVIEPDPDFSINFVLPPLREELSEKDLDSVAGGSVTDVINTVLQTTNKVIDIGIGVYDNVKKRK